MITQTADPRPTSWPYRADPPGRYWGNYDRYIRRGGLVRLEDDIRGFTAGRQNEGDISRFYFFCSAFDQLMKEGIRGEMAELGVYRGHTASLIAMMARRMGTTAYLLDTYQGFNPDDLKGIDAGHRMQFEDTSLEAVRALIGDDHVQFVKGYFPDSAAELPDDLKFALVHIDCDLYSPIVSALNYFYPRLLPGGYLIIHDYFSLAWDGAEKAVDEFFADKIEPITPLTDGCGSAVIRKAKTPGSGANWLLQKKCALFSGAWASAGGGGLALLLANGWSGDEDWGLWGVGASHTMTIHLHAVPTEDIRVEAHVGAALVGSRRTQAVDVIVQHTTLATWEFTREQNNAVRSVLIPAAAVSVGDWDCPVIRLKFQPHDVTPINILDPARNDIRPLGLALIRLRRGVD